MPTEPMITIKDADGTMRQVPLSQLAQQTSSTVTQDKSADVSNTSSYASSNTSVDDDIAELAARAAAQVAEEGSALLDDTRTEDDSMVSTIVLPDAEVPVVPIEEEIAPNVVEAVPDDVPIENSNDTTISDKDTTPQVVEDTSSVGVSEDAPSDTNVPANNDIQLLVEESRSTVEEPRRVAESEESTELLVPPTPGPLSTTTPNTHIFESHGDWDAHDHTSLLDEQLHESETIVPHSTSRPGMAASLATMQPASAQAVSASPATSDAVRPKKPNVEQFNQAFAAIAPRTDTPYTPGLKKVPMNDIVAQAPPITTVQPIGPVAELSSMTLDDFRRLGGRGEVGIADLRTKFELLLQESIVLYMQGVAAWHQSPLYRTYVGVIDACITARIPIDTYFADTTSNPSAITAAEWHALVGLHADIRL
jgi:hypothetical protein